MWFIPLKNKARHAAGKSVFCAEIPELFLFTGRDAWSVLRRECVL